MDAVEEVKQRLAIEDVLGEYVELKRAGRNFKALSPFSAEKTPSLMISPEKQIWHDFSSGKGGNMFSFVMEMEGLDFKGALELLARKAGVDLSQYRRSGGENTKLKNRLSEAHELATKFYQVQFSQNQKALQYIFKKRGINKETALNFRIGYAPNTGSALSEFLRKKGFTVDELQKAGLAARRSGRPTDMFRGRIIIPLMDPQGQVIGFTGRLLEDIPNAPKYLNTPQTLLYDKGRHVFGLHLAKESIRKNKFVVLVEGNMDVVASHQASVNNVVATAGTALTEMHLKALGRFVHDVRLAFDQDNAGIAATERAIPIAAKTGVALSMVTVVGAKDPDELIQQDPSAWQKVIDTPEYALDWIITQYQKRLDINSALGKKQFSDVVLTVIRSIADPVEQEHYLEKLGKLLGVSKEALMSKLQDTKAPKKLKTNKAVPVSKEQLPSQSLIEKQNHLLAITYSRPMMRDYLAPLTPDMLFEDQAKELLGFLLAYPDQDDFVKNATRLRPLADYVKMLELIFEEEYQDFDKAQLDETVATLRANLIDEYTQKQETLLTIAYQQAGDDESKKATIRQKMEHVKQLRKDYHYHKRGL